MARGAFILFEGVDRCGKTTQAKRLVERLNSLGRPAVFMNFPDRSTAIGAQINAYLTQTDELDDRAVHLLFSANRWEKRSIILRTLLAGTHIIMDRYAFSGVAFSSAKPGLDMAWCAAPDEGLPAPDAVLFMDLPPAEQGSRGGFGVERYEKPAFQTAVRAAFLKFKESTPQSLTWVDMDAAGTIEEVGKRVDAVIEPIITSTCTAAYVPIRTLWSGNVSESDGSGGGGSGSQ